ncbi:hypothetical protein [Robertkochia aurantiaca]|uniref:hypothetical protein n=1 Tax=Robertkochia aurantiaca TaxID=2873700 RepID=UPI001CCE47A5|nr:hypothetical protein [Robertkochia sp. 3YJGBD-33]
MQNHIYPERIAREAEKALSYYPNLAESTIVFRFKKKIKKSVMQAQPDFKSFFKRRKNRKYYIFISERFQIDDEVFETDSIPEPIMTGWLGHELGHIMDYENRSKWNLIAFGIRYSLSSTYLKEAERMADYYAVRQGMEEYIIQTKNFILDHADLSDQYKERIKKYYLSPEEIMHMVSQRDDTATVND